MTPTARLASLRPESRTLVVAARMAESAAANDNAGLAWQQSDQLFRGWDRHIGTVVCSRHARTIHFEITSELDPGGWRVWMARQDGRLAVQFIPAGDRSAATERQERAFRAFIRAAGMECS